MFIVNYISDGISQTLTALICRSWVLLITLKFVNVRDGAVRRGLQRYDMTTYNLGGHPV